MVHLPTASSLPSPFLAKQHVLFALRSLKFLPTPYQAEDSNRLTLAYFCLSALSLLPASAVSTLNPELSAAEVMLTSAQREAYINWVYAQQIHSGGFRGSDSMDGATPKFLPSSIPDLIQLTMEEEEEFARFDDYESDEESIPGTLAFPPLPTEAPLSPASLIQSYTALSILGILSDDFGRLDRKALVRFIARCQNDDGSFSQFPGSLEPGDPRSTYSAFAISSMLSDWNGVDIDQALVFLASCQRPEGGFANLPHLEAQGGTTYCAIASYALASQINKIPNPDALLRWLVHRQVPPPSFSPEDSDDSDTEDNFNSPPEVFVPTENSAGFQGREGKDTDACYSFWCSASLKILDPTRSYLRPELDRNWLISCQHPMYGGIARERGAHPDVYHTYLALAALAVGNLPELKAIDAKWNVSVEVADRIRLRLGSKSE